MNFESLNLRAPAEAASPPRNAVLAEETVEAMARMLRVQTPECIMETFGISRNAWHKLRKGKPVRASVVERLVERLKTSGIMEMERADA